jgi:uncharacterized protein
MKLNEHVPAETHLIRRYSAAGVLIGTEELRNPCLVMARHLIRDLRPKRVEELDVSDLEPLWPLAPQVLLVGTGRQLRFAPAAVRAACAARRIAIESMDLGAACRTYNVLVQEDRAVAALLFPEPEADA